MLCEGPKHVCFVDYHCNHDVIDWILCNLISTSLLQQHYGVFLLWPPASWTGGEAPVSL